MYDKPQKEKNGLRILQKINSSISQIRPVACHGKTTDRRPPLLLSGDDPNLIKRRSI
jgi:hypothetical protein